MLGKKFGKISRFLLAAVLALTLAVTPNLAIPATAANSISENESERERLKEKKAELDKQLEAAKQNTEDQKAQQEALQAQIEVVQQQIDASNQQILALDEQISTKQAEIGEKQAEIDANMELLKQRLRAIYMAGEATTLDIILGAEDFNDFLDKTAILQSVSQHDTELIQGIQKDMAAVQEEKAVIEENRAAVAQAKIDLDSQQQELTGLLEQSEALLAELEGKQRAVQDSLDEADEELQDIEKAISEYYARQKAETQQQNPTSNDGGSYVGSGQFIWPTPGFTYLSSYWGDGRNHGAIDIAGSNIYGSKVVAADSGTVVLAESGGWGGGYGTYLMIDHGNGYATLYAHLSGLAVSQGQTVQQGQVIGFVGSTGYSTGPHLHFEIRVNGVKQNPMNWF